MGVPADVQVPIYGEGAATFEKDFVLKRLSIHAGLGEEGEKSISRNLFFEGGDLNKFRGKA
jgi:hypothetical protein